MNAKEKTVDLTNLSVDAEKIQKMTVAELLERHCEESIGVKLNKAKAENRRESTIRNQIKPYAIGSLQVSAVKPKDILNHIEMLIKDGKLSMSSVEKTYYALNGGFNWACVNNYIRVNPCAAVSQEIVATIKKHEKINDSDSVVIVLSPEQIDKVEKYIRDNKADWEGYKQLLGLSVLFLLYTGMRSGELCALRWSDYDKKLGTLSITKTRYVAKDRDSGKTVPAEDKVKNYKVTPIELSKDAISVLEEMYQITDKKGQDDYILVNRNNNPSNPSNYGTLINRLYKEIGLPDEVTGAHVLRRTFATQLYDEGCTIEDIAAYLRDTPETVRKHYISLTKQVISDGKVKNVVKLPKNKGNK